MNTPVHFGDVPLPRLLQDHPDHGFELWEMESYLQEETLRSIYERAEKVRLILCGARHALDPNGPQSEQECLWRERNGACLHGEQWTSGLGIIRQLVQSAYGVGVSSSEELQYIIKAQDILGTCDFFAHRNAPDIRAGMIELKLVEDVVEKKQKDVGTRVIAIRDAVAARVRGWLDVSYTMEHMSTIRFTAPLWTIGSWTILVLPKSASAKLPSRGMAMVEGTINGSSFQAPLEPDGKGSHWLRIEKSMKADAGSTATIAIEPMKEWPDPKIPSDWERALAANPTVQNLWKDITPIARWDWIRWIRMSKNPETRKKHIEVALSKMKSGERRPCCFNRSICTEPDVAKGGVLLEPNSNP